MSEQVRAWSVAPVPAPGRRLEPVTRPVPDPGPGEVLVAPSVCGVCRTDLHLADGDLAPRRPGTVPGHEVVGRVVASGPDCRRFSAGDRVGGAWLWQTCGACRWCRAGRENLCPDSRYTGWHVDGGFAELVRFPEAFLHRLPDGLDDEQAAPLLCSGIIGYRALRRANLPPGGRLGLYGFGASAHLTAQVAVAQGAEVHVLTREEPARALARRLGAAYAGPLATPPPVELDAAVLFAPVGDLVPTALAALAPGGTLAVAGIHLTDVPTLDYAEHLFRERTLTSVTANTRADGEELLRLAPRLGLRASVTTYPFDATDQALEDLRRGAFTGAAVVRAGPPRAPAGR